MRTRSVPEPGGERGPRVDRGVGEQRAEDGDGVGREPAVALEGGLQPALGLELPQTREVQPRCGEAVLREYLSSCLS